MQRVAALAFAVTMGLLAAPTLRAQEFVPPDRGRPPSQPAPASPSQGSSTPSSGVNFGIFGFTTRGGVQVNRGSQGLIGSTVDVMTLGSPAVRLRPSFEMGFGDSFKSIAANVEAIYRFQPDQAPAIPYLGLGIGYYNDSTATRVWPTVVMGFELQFTRSINWLVEYHALDGVRVSRFFVGLATRGAN